ncbi:class I SAM-dependent methyltransferase [Sphingomonas nostoxanthinifaciens]|uniref:class I SAM-dependent methyltransferase n=1 Tax=Sphingomonas nostoxanthinifaciens TaxID=2872652 RepID=UPI001CC1F81D|nr:class I SAM-dependent methyltransferase [Sphingomonas nostoxanthinifaciens]
MPVSTSDHSPGSSRSRSCAERTTATDVVKAGTVPAGVIGSLNNSITPLVTIASSRCEIYVKPACSKRLNCTLLEEYVFDVEPKRPDIRMINIRIGPRLARAWRVLRTSGARNFTIRVANKVRLMLGAGSAGQRAYAARKAAIDAEFDRKSGVDTGGVQHLYDLTVVGGNAGHGTSHIASDPGEFATALAMLDRDLSVATFVDLGSGKGRALLMAAAYPFRRLIGVEFTAEMHAVATANLAGRPDRDRFELVHGDAAAYEFPDTPLVLFLFNPFDAPVVAAVAERALASWRRNPRPITVLYVNPLQADAWLAAGWRECARDGTYAMFEPA